jgi:hypothetical protein
MTSTPHLTDQRNLPLSPITPGNPAWQGAIRPQQSQATANLSRQFDRVTLACALGGVALGTAGCILGACMPYRHPVAVAISVIWWGIYCGCFGVSLGALIAFFSKRTPVSPSPGSEGAGNLPSGAVGSGLLAGYSSALRGAKWAGTSVSDRFPFPPMGAPGGWKEREMVFNSAPSEGSDKCRGIKE